MFQITLLSPATLPLLPSPLLTLLSHIPSPPPTPPHPLLLEADESLVVVGLQLLGLLADQGAELRGGGPRLQQAQDALQWRLAATGGRALLLLIQVVTLLLGKVHEHLRSHWGVRFHVINCKNV